MTHRELAERYATELNNANRRIMVLETTIADRDVSLEEVTEAPRSTPADAAEDVEELETEVRDGAFTIDELRETIARQDAQLRKQARDAEKREKAEKAKIGELQVDIDVLQDNWEFTRGELEEVKKANAELVKELSEQAASRKRSKMEQEETPRPEKKRRYVNIPLFPFLSTVQALILLTESMLICLIMRMPMGLRASAR